MKGVLGAFFRTRAAYFVVGLLLTAAAVLLLRHFVRDRNSHTPENVPEAMQCGHYAVMRCCQLLGVPVSSEEVTSLMPHRKDGHSLLEIAAALRECGLHTEGMRMSFSSLREVSPPTVVLFRPPHWLTVAGISAEEVTAYDDHGRRVKLSHSEFRKRWTGIALRVWRESQSASCSSAEAPRIRFDSLVADKGDISSATRRVPYEFRFRNTGGRRLQIKSVHANCACIIHHLEKTDFDPGEEGLLVVSVDPRKLNGGFVEDVVLETNDPKAPLVRMIVSGNADTTLRIHPRIVDFGRLCSDCQDPVVRTVVLSSGSDAALEVEHVAQAGDAIRLRIIMGRPLARSPDHIASDRSVNRNVLMLIFALCGRGSTEGSIESGAVLTIGGRDCREIVIPMVGEIVPPVEAIPRSLYFGEVDAKQAVQGRLVVLSNGNRLFRILRIETEGFPLEAVYPKHAVQEARLVFGGLVPDDLTLPGSRMYGAFAKIHYVLEDSDANGVISVPVYYRVRPLREDASGQEKG